MKFFKWLFGRKNKSKPVDKKDAPTINRRVASGWASSDNGYQPEAGSVLIPFYPADNSDAVSAFTFRNDDSPSSSPIDFGGGDFGGGGAGESYDSGSSYDNSGSSDSGSSYDSGSGSDSSSSSASD